MRLQCRWRCVAPAVLFAITAVGCARPGGEPAADSAVTGPALAATPADLPTGILVALAVLDKNPDGSPKTLPAQLGMLIRSGGEWRWRALDDADSNVYHKAMVYAPPGEAPGVLTLGGTQAVVKLWRGGSSQVLWRADFGGKWSRMREAEVGVIYGDGRGAIAVATDDQGVGAVLHPDGRGGFEVRELDRQRDIVVHEVELGDLDGDGTLEIYATPSEPNKVDGSAQRGSVVRYVPAKGEGRTLVADLGDRHAKEILVADVEGDGKQELYVSIEAVSGGGLEVKRYEAGTDPQAGVVVASIDDTQCRFLVPGDVDGDGKRELVAATFKKGLYLLRPPQAAGGAWTSELIEGDSSGFEHATMVADLDADGRDEVYAASDDDDEIRRYSWDGKGWQQELLTLHLDGKSRFTWNMMPAPVELLPMPAS